jgi:hypothetical protein
MYLLQIVQNIDGGARYGRACANAVRVSHHTLHRRRIIVAAY